MDKDYVLDKLKTKKELDPSCIGFGVEGHSYKLNSTITEKELDKLEKKFDISLPEDYRFFVLNIGNGGAGPSYGLYSIQGALTGICPTYSRYRGNKVGKEITRNFIRPDEIDDDEYEEDGMLILCQHGCANDDFLIVNGSERGFVWEYIEWVGHHVPLLKEMPDLSHTYRLPESERDRADKEWIISLLKSTKEEKMTFIDWYSDWLDKPPHILPNAKKRKKEKRLIKWFNFFN